MIINKKYRYTDALAMYLLSLLIGWLWFDLDLTDVVDVTAQTVAFVIVYPIMFVINRAAKEHA